MDERHLTRCSSGHCLAFPVLRPFGPGPAARAVVESTMMYSARRLQCRRLDRAIRLVVFCALACLLLMLVGGGVAGAQTLEADPAALDEPTIVIDFEWEAEADLIFVYAATTNANPAESPFGGTGHSVGTAAGCNTDAIIYGEIFHLRRDLPDRADTRQRLRPRLPGQRRFDMAG